MTVFKQFLTKNDCYNVDRKITPKGLMIHSTGANNPKLSRYIQPDDGKLGVNTSKTDWNRSGIDKCVHGFIGKDKDGVVRTYQTLPWDHRAWGAGGDANNTHIQVEICEDDLKDKEYFLECYNQAVELFVMLAKQYKLTEKDVICHSEGYELGIASNHGDVMHWFPKHGKSMDTFRADIKKGLAVKPAAPKPPVKEPAKPTVKTIDQLAKEVIDGKHGSGEARKKSLGKNFDVVQKRVNEIVNAKPIPKKTVHQLAEEVIKGMHGSGRERLRSLGDQYDAVQKEVNRIIKSK